MKPKSNSLTNRSERMKKYWAEGKKRATHKEMNDPTCLKEGKTSKIS